MRDTERRLKKLEERTNPREKTVIVCYLEDDVWKYEGEKFETEDELMKHLEAEWGMSREEIEESNSFFLITVKDEEAKRPKE